MGVNNTIVSFFKHLFRRQASPAVGRETSSTTPRTGGVPFFTTGATALNVSTVYRCVNLLADSVGSLPVQYMRLREGIFAEDRSSRLHYLLNVQPDRHLSAVEFWTQAVRYILLRGNAYIVPLYNVASFELDRLALVDPAAVAHDTVLDVYTVSDPVAGVSGTYREEEIIHLKNYSLNGKTGLSTLSFARLALDIARTGDQETLDRFVNGGNVRGIVGNDTSVRGFGEYQDKQLKRTASDIDTRFRSGERIVALPGQVQYTPLAMSSADMQFLETRKFSVREICRFFGVHPSFVFDDTSNNYKSAEMAQVAFLTNTLNPLLRKIEGELLRKLVSPSLSGKRRFQFDRRGLYACDLDSRVKYQTQTIAAGLYTVNEWRSEENKPPVPGGDEVLVSANLRRIDEPASAGGSTNEPTHNDSSNGQDD